MNTFRLPFLILTVCMAACGSDDDDADEGMPAGCGNGIVDSGEVCDDGNRLHGDGCSADCRSNEACGNGVVDVQVGEACDATDAAAACRSDCTLMRCGDGIVDQEIFEACDEGASNSLTPDAPCRPNCQPRECGDGVVDTGELCDDGSNVDGDGCSHDCSSLET